MPSKLKIEAQRRYFFIDEVSAKLGFTEHDIIHLAAHGDFPIYALADNLKGRPIVIHDELGASENTASISETTLSGPIRLFQSDIEAYERNSAAVVTRFMGDTAGYSPHEPEHWEYRLSNAGIAISDLKLIMMASDVEGISNPSKPLTTREKNTLLKMIYALAQEANYDLNQAGKAGTALEASMQKMGIGVGAQTIAKHFESALLIGGKPLPKS